MMLAVSVAAFVYRDEVARLDELSYLRAFLIAMISSATIILPMPSMMLIFALGRTFNPALVGLVAATGGAIGEIIGYLVGLSGHRAIASRKIYLRTEKWVQRWGMIAIFVFAVFPFFPIDIVGITAGTLRFPMWKFLLAAFLGKAVLYSGMALSGSWDWETWIHSIG